MENSFLQELGHIELDLPEPPEKATRTPPQPVDPYLRYEPKAEITHIFRIPEKRPPQGLALTFLGLVLLPILGFLVGLLRLGLNLKSFPTSSVPSVFAILALWQFSHSVLFWLKEYEKRECISLYRGNPYVEYSRRLGIYCCIAIVSSYNTENRWLPCKCTTVIDGLCKSLELEAIIIDDLLSMVLKP